MAALELDYARRLYGDERTGRRVLVLALVALVALGAYLGYVNAQIDKHRGEASLIEQSLRRQTGQVRPLGARELEAQLASARAVMRRLSLPWDALFRAIESADAKTVALLTIQPNAERRTLAISGEAKAFEHVLDYIRQLERSDPLVNVHLTNHKIEQQDPQKPVRFTLVADWAG
jgi:Tfp pilus assembly protein PilN